MTNIILCGGSGTRLWPLSRSLLPKQFVRIFDDESLFQLCVKRNLEICSDIIVVSNKEQYFLALEQIEQISNQKHKFLLESIAKNTAPAIALACFALPKDEIILITPSDHLINNEKEYQKIVQKAKIEAKKGHIVTFGIKPTAPHTGYGYIQANKQDVLKFTEKPNLKIAKEYLKQGDFYWNSGMFCFQAGVFLDELKKFEPEIYKFSKFAFENSIQDENCINIRYDDMKNIPENSIDYAVLEKSKNIKMIVCELGWSDLGSFESLHESLQKDENQNSNIPNLHQINSKNNFIYAKKKTISLIDIENLIIVDTDDALLISKQGSSEKVKEIVKELKEQNSNLANSHITVYRPWGSYTILEDELGYKIKKIIVKPTKRLSLQKHFHRNEHWIVVSGTAIVRVGQSEKIVRANESTYIPMGETHRLLNPGKIDLVLIEAQVGEYLEEDDIVRLDDDFKRVE